MEILSKSGIFDKDSSERQSNIHDFLGSNAAAVRRAVFCAPLPAACSKFFLFRFPFTRFYEANRSGLFFMFWAIDKFPYFFNQFN